MGIPHVAQVPGVWGSTLPLVVSVELDDGLWKTQPDHFGIGWIGAASHVDYMGEKDSLCIFIGLMHK